MDIVKEFDAVGFQAFEFRGNVPDGHEDRGSFVADVFCSPLFAP